jgi:hypothetical protein
LITIQVEIMMFLKEKFLNGPIRCRLKGFSEWIFGERLLSWKIHAPSWKKAMPSWKI